MMNVKYTTISIEISGSVSVGNSAFFDKKSKNIICLTIDVDTKYPSVMSFHGSDGFSGLFIYNSGNDDTGTQIRFSELKDWRIFCCECGKNCIYVTLIKE